MGCFVFTGNSLESLAGVFCDRIYNQASGDILNTEKVVVPSRGTGTYLEQFIASTGIATGLEMPFLRDFIDRSLGAFLSDQEEWQFRHDARFFSQESLTWQIDRIIRDYPDNYPELTQGIGAHPEPDIYRHELAAKIAAMYDRCQYHRPLQLLDFVNNGNGKQKNWQSRLYRQLSSGRSRGREYYFQKAFDAVSPLRKDILPERVSLFGFNYLPPATLNYLARLAEFTDIYFFLWMPSKEDWSDLRGRFDRRKDDYDILCEPENIFLADFGTLGREFLQSTLEHLPFDGVSDNDDAFVPPLAKSDSMLAHLQQDIFEVKSAVKGEIPADDSLQIHNCHSMQREVEILHDQILDAIDSLHLEYRDIIITAPDINEYAPILKAVFSKGELKDALLISDRNLSSSGPVTGALMQILRLPVIRCTAGEIIEIISQQAVQAKFSITDTDLESIRKMVSDSAILWGMDAGDHFDFCNVKYNEFSWQDGLARLWQGFAIGDDDDVSGTVPVRITCNPAVLGKFAAAVDRIAKAKKLLSSGRTLSDFSCACKFIFDELLPDSENFSVETQFLKRSVSQIFDTAERNGIIEVSAGVITEEISSCVKKEIEKQMFLRGKINCCSMVPMRNIPAKVIAVLGMGENQFPRIDREISFDLMAKRLRGERSRVLEDRYIFLEILLAAKERLLFFYSGQNDKDASILPPSIPLAELSAYMQENYAGFSEIRHKAHNFAPEYFRGGELFSYDRTAFAAARGITASHHCKTTDFLTGYISENAEDHPDIYASEISLDELISALCNPCMYFLKSHSDLLRLDKLQDTPEDAEPENLPPWKRLEYILFLLQNNTAEARTLLKNKLLASRLMPRGQTVDEEVSLLQEWANKLTTDDKAVLRESTPRKIAIDCQGINVSGEINCNDHLSYIMLGASHDFSPKDMVNFYCRHLFLCAFAGNKEISGKYIDLKRGKSLPLPCYQPEDACERLGGLIQIARKSTLYPLPFFCKTGWKIANTAYDKDPYSAATKEFSNANNFAKVAEKDDPAISIFYSPDCLDDEQVFSELVDLASEIYRPFCKRGDD